MRPAGRRLGRRPSPRLSVVVPVYNVRDLLKPSLDSILAQPVRDLEVIVVDDGSTDGSSDAARRYAARHKQVTLISQANGGVSRARNVALEHCTGDLVTFVDPDDVLPPNAWGTMLKTLDRTGSDFAVGMMERVDSSGRRSRPPLLHRNHAERRLGVTIDEAPLLIADVFPCNKIFRMEFWRSAGLSFPEGVSYEDQVFSARAFLAAKAFDVHTDVVYDWYVRDDQSSDTQGRARLKNLRDRIWTKQAALGLILGHGNAELTETFYREVLPIDMWEHFRAAVHPETAEPETYWAELRDGVRAIWNDASVPFEQTAVPPGQRLMGWLVAQDRRADLALLVEAIDGPGVPVTDGRYLHPWVGEPGLPEVLSRA